LSRAARAAAFPQDCNPQPNAPEPQTLETAAMTTTVSISPLSRIEGHLAIHTETEAGDGGHRVTQARCEGEMYRGFEQILRGRDPLDAQQITQRICGVCPISHGIASCRAQEMAYGIKPSHNGRLLQNLIFAANYLQSHILHFYHLAALDFVDVTAVLSYSGRDRTLNAVKQWVQAALERKDSFAGAPFLPRFEVDYVQDHDRNVTLLAHYVEALDVRKICHEMAAVFGARLPHSTALVPGGCTQTPTMERVVSYEARLRQVASFVEHVYLPDLLEVAKEFPQYLEVGDGYPNYLAYGVFEMNDEGTEKLLGPGVLTGDAWRTLDPQQIAEDVGASRFADGPARHPYHGETHPEPHKAGAYSWIKAPRYQGMPMEVGPLARVLVNYHAPGNTWVRQEVDAFCAKTGVPVTGLNSVLGRHVARGLEAHWVARQAAQWLDEIQLDARATREFKIPTTGSGHGLTEAPRGALGHWLRLEEGKIANYQCVVPTTWNCSPRDARQQPGPVEKALENTPVADPEQPIEIARVVHAFDPCLACAIH
jgi:ferredoxin hydrogenase large subunit/hydrogenase large subunit